MRLWPSDWHPETWICSLRGHCAPATHVAVVEAVDADLGVVNADGRRMARCLRCDCWIRHLPPTGPDVHAERLGPIAELDLPRRGEPLREAIFMRLIAINKGSHALAFTVMAVALALVRTNLLSLQDGAQRILRDLDGPLSDTGQQHSRSWLGRHLEQVLDLEPNTIGLFLGLAVVYAVIEWSEAVGLWLERRWAEYLTVVATAGFLPLEVHELLQRVTVLRILALVVNVALLVWLVRNKRLFGVRGGIMALEEANTLDWPAILAEPTPATTSVRRPRRFPA